MDAVIKVGGSLQADPAALRNLCKTLKEVSERYRLLIIPGGGSFADLVCRVQTRHGFSDRAAHRMAILTMDIYGLMLHDLIGGSVLTDIPTGKTRKCSIFLPFKTMGHSPELEPTWGVTSDSIAALVTSKIGCKRLLLVKMVDGILAHAQLKKSVSTQRLRKMDQHLVDPKFPETLERAGITCWIVNGKHPDRIKMILDGKETICTKISLGVSP